ncbi:hypothetical protein L6164_031155 [Bauhinia variegata]|uniref:Uncharacterized protein n=1 Tax=Bauhinia variegata TaxID=167791 RepID=A0ACB9LE49_BAUVA|nr:hypothetical protein L6164_031155 [Bauhinia variegata]
MAVAADLFMSLDESLLIFILSLIPFKEAARTSILSKRWRNLWKSTTNIEFNELHFVKPDQPDKFRETQKRVFIDFVNDWLHNFEGSVSFHQSPTASTRS